MLRFATKLATALGLLAIVVDEQKRLTRLGFVREDGAGAARRFVEQYDPEVVWSSGQCDAVIQQLREYCNHQRKHFDLPLAPQGTAFQQRVWQLMLAIPYGEVRTYGELAVELGLRNGARAVGGASAHNPIAIVIPCHRVVGSRGQLTGYAGGLALKDKLLVHEGVRAPLLFPDA